MLLSIDTWFEYFSVAVIRAKIPYNLHVYSTMLQNRQLAL
jgi:hypothetical protein